MRRLALITMMMTFALPVGVSQAGFFPSVQVDTGNITETRDVDLAPDGTGAVTFARIDGAVQHAYVNRFVAGVFQGSERVDPGLEGGSSVVSVGAGNGGRLAVLYTSGGNLYGNVRPSATAAWTGPQFIAAGGTDSVIKMTVHGVAFGAFRVGGTLYSVYVPRLSNNFVVNPGTLNIDPAKQAGVGNGRARIAVSAQGSGIVVWGEPDANNVDHVYARRVFQGSISAYPQDLSLPSLENRPGLGSDLPDVAAEDDASFAWVVYRQSFDDGGVARSRIIARQLRGSTFDPPVVIDPVGWSIGVGEPHISMNTRGEGMATFVTGWGAPVAATLKDTVFNVAIGVGAQTGEPVSGSALSSFGSNFIRNIYFSEGTPGVIKGRTYLDSSRKRTLPLPGPTVGLTSSQFGVTQLGTGFDVAADSAGDSLAYFSQGSPGARTAVVAGYDLPPDNPAAVSKWTNSRKPHITWKSDGDTWGPVTYSVYLGGVKIGQTNQLFYDGTSNIKYAKKYKIRIDATDVRGQITHSSTTTLQLDTKSPSVDVDVKREKRRLTVKATVSDKGTKKRPASGIGSIQIDWGDGTIDPGSTGTHTYKNAKRVKVKITAIDKAGNRRTVTKRA